MVSLARTVATTAGAGGTRIGLTGTLMSTSMFTSAEGTIAELAFVFLLGRGGLLGWTGRGGDGGSHVNRLCGAATFLSLC
jgi:hypothetical protein